MLIWYIFFLYAYLKFLLSSLSVVYIIISLFFNLHNTLPSLIVSCSLNISFVFNLNPTIWVFFSLSLCVYVCLSVCLSFTYFILSFSLLLRSGTTFFNLSTVSTRLWISICVFVCYVSVCPSMAANFLLVFPSPSSFTHPSHSHTLSLSFPSLSPLFLSLPFIPLLYSPSLHLFLPFSLHSFFLSLPLTHLFLCLSLPLCVSLSPHSLSAPLSLSLYFSPCISLQCC